MKHVKKIYLAVGKNLSFPINPWLISLIGLFSITYSFYLYVPKQNEEMLEDYSFVVDNNIIELIFFFGISIGLWLFTAPLFAKKIEYFINPTRAMSIYWLSVAIIVALGDWTIQSIVVYVFLSLFCVISAANFSMNRHQEFYKDIFS